MYKAPIIVDSAYSSHLLDGNGFEDATLRMQLSSVARRFALHVDTGRDLHMQEIT